MKIGLIAGSFKPLQSGHYKLIELASDECDKVHLYVSLSDRARPGEVPILGKDMDIIWHQYIEPVLPSNVEVIYGGSPIANVWKELGEANEAGSLMTYVLYADTEDAAQNFSDDLLVKYTKNLFYSGQIIVRAISRTSTVNVSGSKMRSFLATGDKVSFINNLPEQVDGEAIWEILRATAASKPKVKKTAGAKR